MNTASRTITGIAAIGLGIFLIVISFQEALILAIYGLGILVIGLYILFNKKEDDIEQIKR